MQESGVSLFKNIVYDAIKKDTSAAIISLINQERENNEIDRGLIKKCVEIFEAMGMGNLETYEMDLEAPLIESSRVYYQQCGDKCILEDSTPVYLIRIEKILAEEKNRILSYLNLTTEAKLLSVLDTVLIESKLQQLLEKEGSGLHILLQNDRFDDIMRMFQLFNRLKNGIGVNMMADIFREHIIKLGNDTILERKQKLDVLTAALNASKESKDAAASSSEKLNSEKETYLIDTTYLKELITIHEKYIQITKTYLQNNSLFHKAIKDSYMNILNKEVSKINNIQILNTFCDNILKTSSYEKITSESEIENYLEKIVQLFTYITDKDLFNEIYRNLLAKRLLSQRSSSDDMEKLMISKLKLRCGSQFTSKMEGMLTDLSIANDHQNLFKKSVKEKGIVLGNGVDFTVQVLTTGYWPTYKIYNFELPSVMNHCCKVFNEFYESETSRRKLQWIFSQGEATIKAILPSRTYEIQVTTLQAAVLLAFSSQTTEPSAPIILRYETLLEMYQLPEEALKRVMHSFACGKIKILKKDVPSPVIKNTDIFSCNEKFR